MAISAENQQLLSEAKANGMNAENLAALTKILDSDAQADTFFRNSVLRQADYSRNMDAVNKAKADAEKAIADAQQAQVDVSKFREDLTKWHGENSPRVTQAQQKALEADAKANKAIQRLRDLAALNPAQADEILGDLKDVSTSAPPPPVIKQEPTMDTSKFLTADQMQEAFKRHVNTLGMVDATFHDLNVKHQELFGKPLTNAAGLLQEATTAGKSLSEYVATKFKFSEREAALAEERTKAREAEIRAEERAKVMSEAQLNGGHVTQPGTFGEGSSVLARFNPIMAPGTTPPAAPLSSGNHQMEGVSAAVASFTARMANRNK